MTLEDEAVRRIEGRVARILNSRELVVNQGSVNGVEEGQYFGVYEPELEDVLDPESGKMLGRVMRPKVKIQITQVAERFSIGRTFEKTKVNVGGSGGFGSIAGLMNPPKWETRYQTLRTEEATWEKLPESESFVKTGDLVRQLGSPDEGPVLENNPH